jgi:hypothetical protein
MPNTAPNIATHETVNYAASPRQYNAPWGGAMGALAGFGAGWIGGCWGYDLAAHIPGLTVYQSLPIIESLKIAGSQILDVFMGKAVFPRLCWFYAPVIPSVLMAVAGAIWGVKASWVYGERHVAGPKFVRQEHIPKAPKYEPFGIELFPGFRITREAETQNMIFIGKPGGGKTTAIIPICRQAIERGDRVLAWDFKGDYREQFPDADYIAPWNKKSCRWQLGADVQDEADAEAFAAGLIPDSSDPLWSNAARALVEGMVMDLQHRLSTLWGWGELAHQLKTLLADTAALKAAIIDYRPLIGARLEMMAEDTLESVIINITTFCEPVMSIANSEKKCTGEMWSVTKWLETDDKVAVIGWSAQNEALSRRVALPIFKIAMQRLLSQENRKPIDEGLWFFIDECGQLGEIPGFISAFTAARSKGGRMVVGFQTFAQPLTFYGDEARAITGCETRVIGRLLNPEDAADASAIAGDRTVERLTVSTTRDGGRTESWPRSKEAIYDKEKFYQLGKCRDGVRLAYIGRGVVSEVLFPFIPKVKFSNDEEPQENAA